MSWTSRSMRRAPVGPRISISSLRELVGPRTPARTASSMSWLMYATRSTSLTIRPSRVNGSVGPVWLRIPSRTSSVRFSPRPSRSSTSTTRSECSLWRKRSREPLLEHLVQRLLPGVPERRVAEVVAEPDRLDEVLVQPQRARDAAGDAGRLERVGQARAVVVALGGDEDLGLVHQPAEGLGVNDAVAVALKGRAETAWLFGADAPARLVRADCEVGERVPFLGADPRLESLGDGVSRSRFGGRAAHGSRVVVGSVGKDRRFRAG